MTLSYLEHFETCLGTTPLISKFFRQGEKKKIILNGIAQRGRTVGSGHGCLAEGAKAPFSGRPSPVNRET
jgi:hypothetical protein